jgi:hypothetical protein
MWGFFLCRMTGWVVDNVEVPGEEGVSFISSEEMLTLERHILFRAFRNICIEEAAKSFFIQGRSKSFNNISLRLVSMCRTFYSFFDFTFFFSKIPERGRFLVCTPSLLSCPTCWCNVLFYSRLSYSIWRMQRIQGVPGGKISILGGNNIGHCKQKSVYVHVLYSERFPS